MHLAMLIPLAIVLLVAVAFVAKQKELDDVVQYEVILILIFIFFVVAIMLLRANVVDPWSTINASLAGV